MKRPDLREIRSILSAAQQWTWLLTGGYSLAVAPCTLQHHAGPARNQFLKNLELTRAKEGRSYIRENPTASEQLPLFLEDKEQNKKKIGRWQQR